MASGDHPSGMRIKNDLVSTRRLKLQCLWLL
jgi:hypothetical protein